MPQESRTVWLKVTPLHAASSWPLPPILQSHRTLRKLLKNINPDQEVSKFVLKETEYFRLHELSQGLNPANGGQSTPEERVNECACLRSHKIFACTRNFEFHTTFTVTKISTTIFFLPILKCKKHPQFTGHMKTGGRLDSARGL